MRHIIVIALLAASLSCNSSNETLNANRAANNSAVVNTAATVSPSKNANTGASNDAGLNFLKSSVGKTAFEINLWDNKEITSRLEKLLGPDYAAMRKYWQTQTPIEAEENVLSLTGCEDNNCGDNQYLMYIDTASNNINVYHLANGKVKLYKEKSEIKLPGGMARDLETMKANAKPAS